MSLFPRLLLLQARWDPATRQAAGFAFALDPVLRRAWGADAQALRRARARHLEHFNTHPAAAWLVAGAAARAEFAAAAAPAEERGSLEERARALKSALGPALAGIYDGFFWGALRPAAAATGALAGLAVHRWAPAWAGAAAAAVLLAVHGVPALWARAWGLSRGLAVGEAAAAELADLPVQASSSALKRFAGGALLACALLAATDPFLPAAARPWAALALGGGAALAWFEVPMPLRLGAAALAGAGGSLLGLWA